MIFSFQNLHHARKCVLQNAPWHFPFTVCSYLTFHCWLEVVVLSRPLQMQVKSNSMCSKLVLQHLSGGKSPYERKYIIELKAVVNKTGCKSLNLEANHQNTKKIFEKRRNHLLLFPRSHRQHPLFLTVAAALLCWRMMAM